MEELKKVRRVLGKAIPGAPHHTWLVLDASTGQNAITQAAAFRDAVAVDGIILTKLDGSAKGGMVFRIRSELGLPVLFAGIGEGAHCLHGRGARVDARRRLCQREQQSERLGVLRAGQQSDDQAF